MNTIPLEHEPIHIVAPFQHIRGGEWNMIDMYQDLSRQHNVVLWSTIVAHSAYHAIAPIQTIQMFSGHFPQNGTLVIGGCTTEIGAWLMHAKFNRIIVIHNEYNPNLLFNMLSRLKNYSKQQIEIRYVSHYMKNLIGLEGTIQPHYPNGIRFKTLLNINRAQLINNRSGTFTIGRISRDTINKHHFKDPSLYKRLRDQGCHIHLMGATCLQPFLDREHGITLLAEQAYEKVAIYLSEIDCFFYRTSLSLKEGFGIVILESMLAGLPVVCHRQGGYAEMINHGVNGFLFDSDEEAYQLILQLKQTPSLAIEIGENARRSLTL